jgi:hypothetical protein
MPRCAGGPGSRIPAVTTRTGFGFQLKGCESQTRSQRRSPRRRWLRDAPLTDERQPDDVTRGLRGLCLCRRTLHIPSGRLVPARGALEGHPALLEVQQRVMAVKTAQELPHVPGRAADQAGRCFCCCAGLWLPGFRPHCRVPLSLARHPIESRKASASTSLGRATARRFSRAVPENGPAIPRELAALAVFVRARIADVWAVHHPPWVTAGPSTAEVCRLPLANQRADDERDIGGTFTKPTHEVWKPFAPEGDVNPDALALPDQR